MNENTKEIQKKIKGNIVPFLREKGFKGSYPNFYRIFDNHSDLLSFQFSRFAAGSFCVEISFVDKEKRNISPVCKEYSLPKIKVLHTLERLRIGCDPKNNIIDHWFEFAINSITGKVYLNNANDILISIKSLLHTQAKGWWEIKRKEFS